MLGCSENTCHVPLYLFPEFTKLWNPASLRPGHPFAQKLADTLISRFQRETEIFLQQISPVQPWIRCREKLQLLLLMFGEILWILELHVSRGFNIFSKLLFRRFGFSFFRTSDMTFLHFFGCTISLRPGSSPDFVQRVTRQSPMTPHGTGQCTMRRSDSTPSRSQRSTLLRRH